MKKFYVYELSLQCIRECRRLLKTVGRQDPDLARQIRRSLTSVPANISEGNGRAGKDRAHLFRVAMTSADEVKAHLRSAEALGYLAVSDIREPSERLTSIAKMLYRLLHKR